MIKRYERNPLYFELLERAIKANEENDISTLKEVCYTASGIGDPYLICDIVELCYRTDDPDIMPILQVAMERQEDYNHIYEFSYLACSLGRRYVDYNGLLDKIIESENPKLLCYAREFVPAFSKRRIAAAMSELGNESRIEEYIDKFGAGDGCDYSYYAASEQEKAFKKRLKAVRGKLFVPKCVRDRGLSIEEAVNEMRMHYFRGFPIVLKDSVDFNAYDATEVAENLAVPLIKTNGKIYRLKDEYALPLKMETIKLFQMAAERTHDMLNIYEFGASVEGADNASVAKYAINFGHPKYMYYIGAYCPGVDLDKMLEDMKNAKANGGIYAKAGLFDKYIELLEEHIKEVKEEKGTEPGED